MDHPAYPGPACGLPSDGSDAWPDVSIVLATRNKAALLANTLRAISGQSLSRQVETIVVDDGSTDETPALLAANPWVKAIRLENDRYRNPSVARNVGYRAARGGAVVCMSDDVVMQGSDALVKLYHYLRPGTFNIATVYNVDASGRILECYTGHEYMRPFFFLGSLFRDDLYAVGGNDEDFDRPGFDDNWFADCLMAGRGLRPVYRSDVIGHHQDHPRPPLHEHYAAMGELYRRKVAAGVFCASGGPWEFSA